MDVGGGGGIVAVGRRDWAVAVALRLATFAAAVAMRDWASKLLGAVVEVGTGVEASAGVVSADGAGDGGMSDAVEDACGTGEVAEGATGSTDPAVDGLVAAGVAVTTTN